MADLEQRLENALAENQELLNRAATDVGQAIVETKTELTNSFEAELGPKVRAWARDAVGDEIKSRRVCDHGEHHYVVMAVVAWKAGMPACEFGGLFGVDGKGNITNQRTCYCNEKIGESNHFKVFAKKCLLCGAVDSVDWFDVAAAGSALVERNVTDLKALKKQQSLRPIEGDDGEPALSLDAVLES
jgi:hypothetical protein